MAVPLYIEYSKSKLFYTKAGEGTKSILLYHGFGQDHRAFQSWTEHLRKNYTVYSFDLFFHGESSWPEDVPLEKKDWKKIIELFLAQEKIETFEVVGFSLGGKFALATLEAFPDRIKKIILLAPDGIKTNLWYSLATYPIVMRSFFKSLILRPSRLHSLIKILRLLRLVDKGMLRFAGSQMDTEAKRKRVYCSWVYFRHLKFDMNELAKAMGSHQVQLTIIIGKHDKIIPARSMNKLTAQMPCQFNVIEAGHNDLIDKSIPYLETF